MGDALIDRLVKAGITFELLDGILALIERLRVERGLAYVLISHNLAVVDRLCESSVVLYRGSVMERGETATLLAPGSSVHPGAARRGARGRCAQACLDEGQHGITLQRGDRWVPVRRAVSASRRPMPL
jgi:ABC-type multidrug transport system ATPase subunit